VHAHIILEAGYTGNFTHGTKLFSKDPLAIVTRGNDAEFADFCNWILHALFAAEAMNITQDRANTFPTTHVFGDNYTDMFVHAIAAVGNFGEIYNRNGAPFPRLGLNLLTNLSNGLLYALPFGDLEVENNDMDQIGPVANGTMESINSTGSFRCGVVGGRPGFATFNETSQEWDGLDTDFCKAVSAAMFEIDVERV
jgi:ABC-type amino acid transport substrate-binding protein